jgi:hypothetical protein
MAWKHVVSEKHRCQEEAIRQFASSNGNSEHQEIDLSVDLATYAHDVDVIRNVSSADISCEALILNRIQK